MSETTNTAATFPGARAGKRKRRWLPLAGGALLAALLVAGLWPRPQPVEIATAARGALRVTVEDEGMTRVVNRYVVAAPVSGQLRRVEWKAGAAVQAGKTVLAVLETGAPDLLDASRLAQAEARLGGAVAAMEAASAQVSRAQASHALAKVDRERVRSLWASNTVSRQEVDTADMREQVAAQEKRAAEFGLKVAEYERQQTEAVLQRGRAGGPVPADPGVTVLSPVTGRVLRVFQESSRMMAAGSALMEVGDPADLEVRVEVLSRDAVVVKAGARVLLEQWGGAEPLEARVRWVEPSGYTKISALGVEEQRVNVICDLVSPPEMRPTLGDAYRVEARIVVWENPDVLLIPAGALFQREGRMRAFVVESGVARERGLVAGRSNGVMTEVREGLKEGDRVVVYPGDKVVEGRRVKELSITPR
ncbi:MAG: HlyD family efflux transporter periplasmic adaptor subunit [Opitutaceae bacterium]